MALQDYKYDSSQKPGNGDAAQHDTARNAPGKTFSIGWKSEVPGCTMYASEEDVEKPRERCHCTPTFDS